MLGEDAHLILAGELVMLGDEVPAMGDVQATAAARDLDRLADEREGHRVAIRLEADEVVVGDAPRLAGLEAKPGLTAGGDQLVTLLGEPVRGALVGLSLIHI